MNEKLPRRTLLLGVALGALPLVSQALPVKENLRLQFLPQGDTLSTGSVRLLISGESSLFTAVTAYFARPDGTRLPFFGWSGGTQSTFTMPVTKEGLYLALEGADRGSQTIVLRPTEGIYEVRRGAKGEVPLRIQLTAE